MTGPEWELTENPFVEQLGHLGWKFVTGNLDSPSATGRSSFRDVLLESDLRAALTRINLRNGKPWLDPARLSEAVQALRKISAPKLMEANQQGTKLLHEGFDVDGLPDWNQGRSQTLHFIDWDNPDNNQFTVISQFRVDCPPSLPITLQLAELKQFTEQGREMIGCRDDEARG